MEVALKAESKPTLFDHPPQTKYCRDCEKYLPRDYFYEKGRRCKPCARAASRESRKTRPDRLPQPKQCGTCRQVLPLDHFHSGGRAGNCKECACAATRENYRLNPTQRRTYAKERRIQLASQGLCHRCGKCPPLEGRKSCTVCLERYKLPTVKQKKNEKNQRLKDQVYAQYGGYVCACCGETEPLMLNLDHINNDGNRHRKLLRNRNCQVSSWTMYNWIVQNNFPPIFQVLCYNCNIGKYRNNGLCPHTQRT